MLRSLELPAHKLLHILIGLGLVAQIAGADAIVRRGMAALGARQQMVDGVAVQAAKVAGVIVSGQNVGPEILVAVNAADRPAVHYQGGMLFDERHCKLKINFLMPAAALVAVAAHQNHTFGGRNQGRDILGIRLRPPDRRSLPAGIGCARTRLPLAPG